VVSGGHVEVRSRRQEPQWRNFIAQVQSLKLHNIRISIIIIVNTSPNPCLSEHQLMWDCIR